MNKTNWIFMTPVGILFLLIYGLLYLVFSTIKIFTIDRKRNNLTEEMYRIQLRNDGYDV